MYTVIALDLEGTLISNAMSQFPRHGLHTFLELCHAHLPAVVMYTAVTRERARDIVHTLVDEGAAPAWFAHIEYIPWSGPHKDLGLIEGHRPEQALLVDDNEDYVAPGQHARWIRIDEFSHPYDDDHELQRIWEELDSRLNLQQPWP